MEPIRSPVAQTTGAVSMTPFPACGKELGRGASVNYARALAPSHSRTLGTAHSMPSPDVPRRWTGVGTLVRSTPGRPG